MNPLQIFGYISEALTTVVGLFLMINVIKKDPRYQGNLFMGIAIGSIGAYTGLILIYDIIAQSWAIFLFLPIAMSVILFGAMMLFFSFKIMSESTKWFDRKVRWVPWVLAWLIYSIIIFNIDFITIEDAETVKTQVAILPLLFLVLLLFSFLVKTAYEIKTVGLKVTEGISKERMKIFQKGIYIMIISIFVNIPAHLFDGLAVLTLIFFYVLLAGECMIAYAFLKKF